MLLSDCSELHFQYDEPLRLLRSNWTGTGTAAAVRPCASRLVDVLRQHQVEHYLMELDLLEDISMDDQLWLGTHWLPQLRPLPLRRLALTLSDQRLHNKMAVDALMSLDGQGLPCEVQFFVDPRNALRWLSNDSPRVPELLAEWDASFRLVAVPTALHRVLGREALRQR